MKPVEEAFAAGRPGRSGARRGLAALVLLCLAGCGRDPAAPRSSATAEESTVPAGGLRITSAWCRATRAGAPTAACYATFEADGADRLTSASSPSAERIEIHAMEMDGGIMRMRALGAGIDLPAATPVELKPGGVHFMLVSPAARLREGDAVALTFRFAAAEPQTITAPILNAPPQEPTGADPEPS